MHVPVTRDYTDAQKVDQGVSVRPGDGVIVLRVGNLPLLALPHSLVSTSRIPQPPSDPPIPAQRRAAGLQSSTSYSHTLGWVFEAFFGQMADPSRPPPPLF